MFDDLLRDAGIKKRELAAVLGIKPDTISSWQGRPPQYAVAYLELYINQRQAQEVRQALRDWIA